MWTGIIVAGATAAAGAAAQADAAKKASGMQSDASNKAIALTDRQFNLSRDDMANYRNAGNAALSKLSGGLGLTKGEAVASRAGEPMSRQVKREPFWLSCVAALFALMAAVEILALMAVAL